MTRSCLSRFAIAASLLTMATSAFAEGYGANTYHHGRDDKAASVQLDPRPFYLGDKMSEGPLKSKLKSCSNGPFRKSLFSISHRGAPLQFPEHTREGYLAAARMGAGIIECDVTFTRDTELVCRHAQCDLHTTTN